MLARDQLVSQSSYIKWPYLAHYIRVRLELSQNTGRSRAAQEPEAFLAALDGTKNISLVGAF